MLSLTEPERMEVMVSGSTCLWNLTSQMLFLTLNVLTVSVNHSDIKVLLLCSTDFYFDPS